jgi:hypothetical protein
MTCMLMTALLKLFHSSEKQTECTIAHSLLLVYGTVSPHYVAASILPGFTDGLRNLNKGGINVWTS